MTNSFPQYSITKARDQLNRLVYQAEQGKPVDLTRRGKRVAVIISAEEYDRLSQKGSLDKSPAAFQWQSAIENIDIENIDFDPNEIFEDGWNP